MSEAQAYATESYILAAASFLLLAFIVVVVIKVGRRLLK